MAVPDSVTLRNLSGTYIMNKELSDDTDSVLQLQGIGWVMRKAIKYSAVQLAITLKDDAQGVTEITIVQTTTGGMENTEERWTDWKEREKKDSVFGLVNGKARWVNISEMKDEWFHKLDQKSIEAAGGEVIQTYTESVGLSGKQWTADQVWGFEIINGERRHVRRIVITRGDKVQKIRTVYDWKA
ncbi:hypothetical protein K461DRAFT_317371 [Myriangium duriaei CBS 260.36]|uniref:Uncharacterized protein n=1 Tax=Myriangium duriaei CBS 260.36 TaxID=1168546 RepID=A0A9P4MS70_9PEZI|nr:hypothetical protein K461DRAFT_317371 [Myriangium duriaei CBS 260.36]